MSLFKGIKNKIIKEPINGKIEILNNTATVTNPQHGGKPAILSVPKEFSGEIWIDGIQKTGEISVTEEHKIEFLYDKNLIDEPETTLKMILPNDKKGIVVRKEVKPGRRKKIKDCPKSEICMIELEEENIFEPISEVQIKEAISSEEYQGIWDDEAIKELMEREETFEKIVLKAIEPTPSTSAYYEQLYFPSENSFGYIPKETIIAKLHEEIPGIPGINVIGEEIPFPTGSKLPRFGKGVQEKEGQLIASIEGRLVFEENLIEVVPQLVINRDLSKEDGEVLFQDGDVVVEGNVLEESVVHIFGKLIVKGGIFGCSVYAEGGVWTEGNVSNTIIHAGWKLFLYRKLYEEVSDLLQTIHHYKEELKEKLEHWGKNWDEEIERNREHIQEVFRLFYEFQKEKILIKDEDYQRILNETQKNWNTKASNIEYLEYIVTLLENYKEIMKSYLDETPAEVKAQVLSSCTLYCSGKVEVLKGGSYLSHVESGDSIRIQGTTKGGTIIAENSVELEEYLSLNHSEFVRVKNTKGHIYIQKRHADTLIQIADQRNECFEPVLNQHFKYDEKNTTIKK